MSSVRWIIILGVALVGGGTLRADTVEEAEKEHLDAVLLIEIEGQARLKDLYGKYAAGVQSLLDKFRAAGDLENTLKAKQELKLAEEERKAGTQDFPGIARLRTVLAEEEAKIRAAVRAAKLPHRETLLNKLEVLKADLTKEGKLEEAMAVRDRIVALQSGTVAPHRPVPRPETSPAAPLASTGNGPRLVEAPGGDIPVLESGRMGGEIKLTPGVYRLKGRLQGGGGGLKKGDPNQSVKLHVPEGTSIEGEQIYIDEGTVFAEGSRFREITLAADLGGRYEGSRTLFDQVVFTKGGAWMSGYSAKFVFDQCVFHKTTFKRPGKPRFGMKITNSTFVDCDLEAIAFKSSDDATVEAQGEWLTVTDCHFIDCRIPQSFLYITEHCLFENCQFGPAEEMPLKTKRQVVLYHGQQVFDPPSDRGENLFKVEDGRAELASFGATIEYQTSGGELNFR